MNFIVANVDFTKVSANNFSQIDLRFLTEGLPDGWKRPGRKRTRLGLDLQVRFSLGAIDGSRRNRQSNENG